MLDHGDGIGLAQVQAGVVEIRDLGRNPRSGTARVRRESCRGGVNVGNWYFVENRI